MPVQRRRVLVGAESQDGESVGLSVESRDQRDAGERRRHRREVALQLGRQVGVVDRLLGAAHVGRLAVAVHALLVGRRADHRVELHDGEARVGDENVFVGDLLDLELLERVADEREPHDVVVGSVGERDLIAPFPIRARLARDVARDRRGGDAHVLQREPFDGEHASANDICLRRGGRCGGRDPRGGEQCKRQNAATAASNDHRDPTHRAPQYFRVVVGPDYGCLTGGSRRSFGAGPIFNQVLMPGPNGRGRRRAR